MRFTPWLLLIIVMPVSLTAQPIISPVTELEDEAPEAWAMSFFASTTLVTALGPPRALDLGRWELGIEATQIPHLDQKQRTVGFGGRKEENLNRQPLLVRPRVRVGLPARFALAFSWVPPIELDGVEAEILSLSLERVFVEAVAWSLGGRATAQIGDLQGDLTCSAEDAQHVPGSGLNPFGCQAPSNDEMTLETLQVELTAGRRLTDRLWLHLSGSWQRFDNEFQVDARTFAIRDRSLLLSATETYSFAAGLSWELNRRSSFCAELFWAPLEVERLGQTEKNDDLWNLRTGYRYRLGAGKGR